MKVELIGHYGDDDLICDVARVSYNKRANQYTKAQNEKLIKYLIDHGHCYDEQTEVLTSKGFISWKDVTFDTLIASVDPVNRQFIGFEKPLDLIKKEVDEDLVHFKTKNIDLMVTKGHSLYCSLSNTVEKRKNPDYKLMIGDTETEVQKNVKKIYERPMRMVRTAFNTTSGGNPSLFKLYGFFIGDGNATLKSKNNIRFHLKRERKVTYLSKITGELGYELRVKANNIYSIVINNIGEEFYNMFYENGYKTFPDSFFSMTKGEYDGFIEGLINSDGSFRKNKAKQRIYSSSSLILLNKIQALGAINGDVLSINPPSKHGNIRMAFVKRNSEPRLNDAPHNHYSLVPYKGTVYCATVSKGLLIVRRNNKVVLCGNSSPMRHTLLQFRVSCAIYTERQIFKHTVGISTNSVSGRYVDFSDEYEVIPLGAWRMQSKSSKQGSGGPVEHRYQILADRIQSDVIEFAKKSYQQLLDMEISKEQARTILPLNLSTTFIWTGTLQAFLHLVNLRTKPDAQKETRDVVQEMFRQVREKKLFEATINNWPLDYAK